MPKGFCEWLAQTSSLVLIDDWHRLDGSSLETAEHCILQLQRFPCCVVVATRPGIRPLHQATSIFTLGPLDRIEQSTFIAAYITDTTVASSVTDWILTNASKDMTRLLSEPVVLREFLRLVAANPTGSWKRSRTVPSLLDSVMGALCESRTSRVWKLLSEVEVVCISLSSQHRIELAAVNTQTQLNGIAMTAAEFALELVDIGIWSHERNMTSSFRFSHDLWRFHFQSKAIVPTLISGTDIEKWIANAEDLELQVPFVAGLLRNPILQGILLDGLLKRSVDLYVLALHARGSWEEFAEDYEHRVLGELRAGYLAFIQECCPGMQKYLNPWHGMPSSKDSKLVVVGRSSEDSVSYMFALAKVTGPDVFVTKLNAKTNIADPRWDATTFEDPRWDGAVSIRSADLRMSETRRDSARLIAMDTALKELRALTGQGVLPVSEMVVRERTRAAFSGLLRHRFVPTQAKGMTVLQLAKWVENERGNSFAIGHLLGRSHRHVVHASNLEEDCARLAEYGFSSSRVLDLGVAQHSLRELATQPESSVSAIREWLSHFFATVIKTYRLTIEHGYSGLQAGILSGQFPCKLIAYVKTTSSGYSFGVPSRHSFGLSYWWEAVASWDEAVSVVSIGAPNLAISGDKWPFLEELERKASALGRTSVNAELNSCTLASLEKSDTPVTDFVCAMVSKDLESFCQRIGGAD
jgi:hypothetical protein